MQRCMHSHRHTKIWKDSPALVAPRFAELTQHPTLYSPTQSSNIEGLRCTTELFHTVHILPFLMSSADQYSTSTLDSGISQYSTVHTTQHSTVQYSTVLCCVVLYVLYCTVRCEHASDRATCRGTACSAVNHGSTVLDLRTVQDKWGTVQYYTAQYSPAQYGTIVLGWV